MSLPFLPSINTLGISMNRIDFALGGFNPPHSLPHAPGIGAAESWRRERSHFHNFQQSPGSAIVPTTFFASKPSIPDDVLTKAFQVGNDNYGKMTEDKISKINEHLITPRDQILEYLHPFTYPVSSSLPKASL
ncbi:hypothetical protein SADUNF_Sadunf12G0055400 [Salix dunnii]|uniref:Uncharacterized protein n=1 Tax=Salix dunnii TaxID=1413687 RepID=A0A835MVX3_9ROSI|nr:hypothetical protein SADUNF_Sadunf12G0055400 [Salix dunnii]